MLTFAHTWCFLLLPLPALFWWLVPPGKSTSPTVRVPFLSRVVAAGGRQGRTGASDRTPFWLRFVIWLLLVVALARPQWLEPPVERIIPTRDLLLLVDLSGSMEQQDFTNAAGESVDRLTAAKEVLGEFLMNREGDRVGLVVFGNAPFLQVPFTTDLKLSQQLLEETAVRMAGPRTALGDAIGLGIQLFENSDTPTRTIIALTDGNDTASSVPPVEAARIASDRDITIHTVAMGDPTTVGEEKLDQEALREVAAATNGGFFLAMNHDELVGIYDQLDQIETRDIKTVTHRPRRDLFHWLVAAALVLSLAEQLARVVLRRGSVRTSKSPVRLRVNARTFELETTSP